MVVTVVVMMVMAMMVVMMILMLVPVRLFSCHRLLRIPMFMLMIMMIVPMMVVMIVIVVMVMIMFMLRIQSFGCLMTLSKPAERHQSHNNSSYHEQTYLLHFYA